MRAFSFACMAALGAGLALSGLEAAHAANIKVAGGQAYWEGDPGPVNDPYWTSGQYKYDPYGYMERNRWDPEYHPMTVIGPHSGAENCVFRRRVQISNWDYNHPILRVCRAAPKD
ncbi:hypothetical protein K9U39_18375 [Rhodoblastus acidophilus]|uniref:Uncharacterized protein n=1 Tax=Candidatus Rhodoblastus alkanivorans TaxID=2954117 RepID=A0ABS9Z304_9HYPH|nr:hypothetical protein [Candidatus Rhodoblastus alkanivorans]MCI4677466.1 hypothetical protein [Candidatus Rhodoblastus alkanivorans]MCI4681825.1 hypothetical protein [Candidatus Rhodoblastus alkanivorans]MDI4642875.1 hypothetical protein [Rhodoblastus acidophilus]